MQEKMTSDVMIVTKINMCCQILSGLKKSIKKFIGIKRVIAKYAIMTTQKK